MKLLTINIGGTIIETLDFENKDYTNSYILDLQSMVKLLEIQMNSSKSKTQAQKVTVQGSTQLEDYYITNIETSTISTDDAICQTGPLNRYQVTIILEPSSKNKTAPAMPLLDNSKHFVMNNGVLSCRDMATNQVTEIEVNFKLQDSNNSTQEAETILYLAPSAQVTDVVIDFGSEATQLCIRNRDKTGDVRDFVNLFPKMWNSLASAEDKADEQRVKDLQKNCMQHDESDEHLYRSRFFVKKEIGFEEQESVKAWEYPRDNSLIKLLTRKTEGENLMQSYIPLPNTKIASFGGISVGEIKLKDEEGAESDYVAITEVGDNLFYRLSINAFLRKAIEEIRWQNRKRTGTGDKKQVRLAAFHVLMPNVYDYRKLHDTVNVIRKDLRELIKDMNYPIVGFEISAVSESDASFIGNVALSEPSDFPAGRYLILDAGRGTLDFSIIKHETKKNEPRFQNLYRDGIIGAGNALTYALLLVILQRLASEKKMGEDVSEDIRKYIFSNILGIDPEGRQKGGGDNAKLVELMECLDQYKKMYADLQVSGRKPGIEDLEVDNFENLQMEGLINKIKTIIANKWYISDEQQYLERSMCQLAEAVVGRLKARFGKNKDTNEPDYVVFAGRGFMFAPFKIMVESKLKEAFPSLEEKHFSTENNNVSDKNVCLIISGFMQEGDYDTRLFGQPYMLYGTADTSVPSKNKEEKRSTEKSENFFDKFKSIFKRISDNPDAGGFSGPKIDKGVTGYQAQQAMKISDYSKGITLRANEKNDQILIGNIRHKLPTGIQLRQNFELFFANGHIWIRQSGNTAKELERGLDFGGNRVFESLFPYIQVKSVSDVEIPQQESVYVVPNDFADNQGDAEAPKTQNAVGSSDDADQFLK